eukprot:6407992-Amphidinium_carterae.1
MCRFATPDCKRARSLAQLASRKLEILRTLKGSPVACNQSKVYLAIGRSPSSTWLTVPSNCNPKSSTTLVMDASGESSCKCLRRGNKRILTATAANAQPGTTVP